MTSACQVRTESAMNETSVLSAPGLNLEKDAQRVFGGKDVGSEDPFLKFIVSIRSESTSGAIIECTGTLVAKRVVLTAAHCLEDSKVALQSTTVQFLSTRTEATLDHNLVRRAVQTVRPQLWDDYLEADPTNRARLPFDIGLILLDEDAPVGTEPVKILNEDVTYEEAPTFFTAGFGAVSAAIDMIDDLRVVTPLGGGILRKAQLDRAQDPQFMTQLESEQAKRGICYGDSGAPALVYRNGVWQQIGVSSFVTAADDNACHDTGCFINLGYNLQQAASKLDASMTRASWVNSNIDLLEQNLRVPTTFQ